MDRRQQYYYALSAQAWRRLYNKYAARVAVDGGSVRGDVDMLSILKNLSDTGRLDQVKLLWYGGAGVKLRTSGVNSYVSKAYSVQLPANDLAQTTELSQPWQSGNIAPNEKPCLLNPSGGSRFLSHPSISFGVTEAWSVSLLTNWNGASSVAGLIGSTQSGNTGLFFLQRSSANAKIAYRQLDSPNTWYQFNLSTPSSYLSKNKLITFIADGAGNLSLFVDGVFIETIVADTKALFQYFNIRTNEGFYGKVYYYCIQSGALSATQVAAEYNTLRSLIPERESVVIGSQAWTTSNLDIVCDALGVVIPEVTDDSAWAALTTPAWCYYNNDPANGAIYGKLYNWYAVKQIDDALAATGSEWRVPTQAQFNTLATTLGGASVAGGKMKVAGTVYFASPNIGADNSSGFSGLGSGLRIDSNGSFAVLNSYLLMHTIYESGANTFTYALNKDDATFAGNAQSKKRGASIRLVKTL